VRFDRADLDRHRSALIPSPPPPPPSRPPDRPHARQTCPLYEQRCGNGVGRAGKVQEAPKCRGGAPEFYITNSSPAQNLQVIIHNYLFCMGVLCTWEGERGKKRAGKGRGERGGEAKEGRERLRDPFCNSVPNFVKIGQTVTEISRFL